MWTIVDDPAEERPLPDAARVHALSGNRKRYRECHVGLDWLLIRKEKDDIIDLTRTGTHSDPFG